MKTFILLSIIFCINSAPINDETKDPMLGNFFEGDIAGVDKGAAQIPTLSWGKWPGGIVPYIIDALTYDANQTATILSGMRLIEDQTRTNGKDCIKFVPRTNEITYIRIFNGQGCYSYVGKQSSSGAQVVSLQKPTETNKASCIFKGTVAHELIHALGFWHEQSRPDRDNYVKINWENIATQNQHNFNKYSTSQSDTLGLPYDYYSIMHYTADSFSINGQPTITPLQSGVQLIHSSKKSAITDTDVAEIKKYYGCA